MSTSVNRALIQLFSDRNCGDQAQFDFFVKSDYVERLFKDCASGISSEASTFLQELIFDSEISDPCDPSKSHNDIIDDLRNDVCASNHSLINLEDVVDGAAMEDKIIIDKTIKNHCAQLLCVYNLLKENNSSWCNTIGGFEDLEDRHLRIQVDVGGTNKPSNYFDLPQNSGVQGFTTINSKNEIVIALRPELCDANADPFLQATTLLHEGHHADLYRYLASYLPEGQQLYDLSGSFVNLGMPTLFDLICNNPNDPITTQHYIMLNNYVDDIAKGLWEFNGRYSDWDYYKFIAYTGVWRSDSPCALEILPLADFLALRENYRDNVIVNYNLEGCQ